MVRSKTMMTAMMLVAIAAVLLSAGIRALAGPVSTHSQTMITRSKVTKGTPAGAIKIAKGHNTRGKEVHQKRASIATVHISNRTGWYVDCYIDGDFVGQVGPYGVLYPRISSGNHNFYSILHFDDGSQQAWGPVPHAVLNSFTWTLAN